jgi:hypothetical protein
MRDEWMCAAWIEQQNSGSTITNRGKNTMEDVLSLRKAIAVTQRRDILPCCGESYSRNLEIGAITSTTIVLTENWAVHCISKRIQDS